MPQMAFHFNAANCIGCHSCAAACSEKNDLPPETPWRKVGVLEGGVFPDAVRLNISMACNHCRTPACLRGCPTGAYTKDDATGAVVVNSDTCIGCKYCTFVCPYGAPVFNADKGSVSKCNFCIDRQSEGLDPACVAACLGHALTFGPLGEMENGSRNSLRSIPGFPAPEITRPSIRFSLGSGNGASSERDGNGLPEVLGRLDHVPLLYYPSVNGSGPLAAAAQQIRLPRGGSKGAKMALKESELPLVTFTLLTQTAAGMLIFAVAALLAGVLSPTAQSGVALSAAILLGLGMAASTGHLGKPFRAYRALRNIRTSWLSREIAVVGAFFSGILLYCVATLALPAEAAGLALPGMAPLAAWTGWIGAGVAVVGLAAVFSQAKIYVIPARPYWDDRNTLAQFFLSAVTTGPLLSVSLLDLADAPSSLFRSAWAVSLVGLILQGAFHADHVLRIAKKRDEAYMSLADILGKYGRIAAARIGLWGLGLMSLALGIAFDSGNGALWLSRAATLSALAAVASGEVIGRALFYLAVVPMSVPGAAFYRNKEFERMIGRFTAEDKNGFATGG